ncbi:aryl-sulfate sulfotransferase [Flavobacterium sp. NRK F7]|uniref:aryl-sulfate sulfotransferase n=1 Tax=Flavobacterium sp. NRK F7 TaxID=2954930 RepID=UPI002091696A|nr:aryl-sulfate sulfotransferase [Flavobacterium sp. NRK F7]MCO6161549.1 aryl-sulfate sulfotransferase [Flavobacterium sp. NRK F7]
MKKYYKGILLLVLTLNFSCSKEDSEKNEPVVNLDPKVQLYKAEKIDDSYVFAIENGGKNCYLLNKQGYKVKEWLFDLRFGNDIEILPNGELIAMYKQNVSPITIGGAGGIIRILNSDGSTKWDYQCADDEKVAHHDVELLPNGNVLFLVWEKLTPSQALNYGVEVANDIFPEALFEVNPQTNQLVWEWHSYNHIVQDTNNTLVNYGQINQYPNRINFSYNERTDGDIMHANGIDYDEEKDVIYMSVNFYSEVWVIDHSTTTMEAASNSGGNYNKGGDLLYRFGNPSAYNHPFGERFLFNNHFPNLIEKEVPGKGNMLIYCNGSNVNQSTVYELALPQNFELSTTASNEPQMVWNFTDPDLFYDKISGAVRLKNGNTLITEGDYGYWEVTPDKEVVWKYFGDNRTFWRGYNYNLDDSAIQNLGL